MMNLLSYALFFAGGAAAWTLLGWAIAQTPHAGLVFVLLLILFLLIYVVLWLLDDPIAVRFFQGDRDTWAALLVATLIAFLIGSLVMWGAIQ